VLPAHRRGCPGPQTIPRSDRGLAVVVFLYFMAVAAIIHWTLPK